MEAKRWPGRAEVIWIQYSPAAGGEIPDVYPMLVASTREFNQRVGIVRAPVLLPLGWGSTESLPKAP